MTDSETFLLGLRWVDYFEEKKGKIVLLILTIC